MFSVSEKYSKAIVADTRDMPYRVTLAGVIVLDQSKIPNMTLTESASGNSSLDWNGKFCFAQTHSQGCRCG